MIKATKQRKTPNEKIKNKRNESDKNKHQLGIKPFG